MTSKLDIRSLICGALLGAAIIFSVGAANRRTSWEYTAQSHNGSHPDTAALAKLGNEGWELVGFYTGPEGKYPGFIFKRER